jgi:hypothetical protein
MVRRTTKPSKSHGNTQRRGEDRMTSTNFEYYKACSVCKHISYNGQLITEQHLEELVGKDLYKLTHTFLSKQCFEKYVEDCKSLSCYTSLPDTCDGSKLEEEIGLSLGEK